MARAFEAVKSWKRSYSPALSVRKGESVMLGGKDDEWPGWIWCQNAAGLGGWLPGELLASDASGKTATLLAAFDTAELTVSRGETLEGFEARNGWTWCRNTSGGEGWVPSDCLRPL